jgi:hypothetical protein
MQCKANCGRESDYKLDPLDELCRQCLDVSKETLRELLDKESENNKHG